MKKLLSLLLACLMLATLLCSLVGAEEPAPAQPNKPVGTTALENRETLPVGYDMISKNLLAPSVFSQYSYTADSLTAENRWELGRYLKYGLSVMGVSALERPISGGVDGIWSTGNIGDKLQNGSRNKGAFAYIGSNELYNHLGETDQADSIYPVLITFNFGKPALLDSIGFVAGLNNMPQAADVYTSNDGENWTLIGYWDRTAMRMSGSDMPTIPAADLGKDGTDATYDGGKIVLFDLLGTEAQFLRICAISHAGKTKPADTADYTTYSNANTEKSSWREMIVYGSILDKASNVTALEKPFVNPDAPSTPEDTDPVDSSATTEGSKLPDIPVKQTTEAATTEAAPAATTEASSSDSNTEKGCGATVGGTAFLLLSVISAGVLTRRRREQ